MLETELKAVFENAPFAMYILDTDLRLRSANKVWFEVYENLLGIKPNIGDKMPLQPVHSKLKEAYLRALQGETLCIEEFMLDSINDKRAWFDVKISPIYEQEAVIGVLVMGWDITERKETESQLKEWEIKYQDLINQANDAIFFADVATGKILYANEKAQYLVGKSLEELCQMHHSELHPEHLREQYVQLLREYVRNGTRTKELFLVAHKDGREIPVDISSRMVNFENKQAVQGIFRDMSVHVDAQKALQEQKEFYEMILNHIPIDVAVLDKNDKYVYLNPKAVKDKELREWLVGKGIMDYYQYRHIPAKRGEVKQEHLDFIRKTKIPTKWEDKLIDKQGKDIHLLRRFTPILDEAGEFVMSLFTGENITYLKKAQQQHLASEQRYRNLVETTTDWIWETSREGKFTYCSPQILDILGYTPKEVVGKSVLDFTPNENRSEKWRMFKDIWSRSDNFLLEELEYVHKNGRIVLLQTSGAPIYNHNWELVNYRGIARDVTAQKQAEHLLQKTLHELEERNFELDSFVYKVSHDLRAPLSSMIGLLNLMQTETNPTRTHEYMTLLQDRANKLDTFIKTVLAYSQNLNQEVTPVLIDFRQLVAQCFDELQYMPLASSMQWQLEIEGDTPFYSDEFRLIIIFKNFISNAIKYQKTNSPESALKIYIHLSPECANVEIADNGIGIETKHLPRVFDMFYRATQKSDGSGLGLYIVKQALDKIKSKVRIESTLGEGTTIFLSLPNHTP